MKEDEAILSVFMAEGVLQLDFKILMRLTRTTIEYKIKQFSIVYNFIVVKEDENSFSNKENNFAD